MRVETGKMSDETILYVAPTPAGDSGSQPTKPRYEKAQSGVAPTEACATGKPKPDVDRGWPHGSLTIDLPAECGVTEVGPRRVYRAPANLDGNEVSEWNAVQFEIQEKLERWEPLPVTAPRTDDSFDVAASGTTRDQLRGVVASENRCNQQQALAVMLKERANLEQRLLNWVWVSKQRTLDRNVAAAEAASRRCVTARERLRREAPQPLHDRVTELKLAKRLAERDVDEKGHDNGDKIGWLTERIETMKRLPSITSVERFDLGKYERELAERGETLAKVETELAEVERRLLEA